MEHIPQLVIAVLSAITLILIIIRIGSTPGNVRKQPDIGKSMTIGDRELQEDCMEVAESREGLMAVLSDGMGKKYGGRVSSKIVVETFCDIFQDSSAFNNPKYFFQRSFQNANRQILTNLEEGSGAASAASVLIKGKTMYHAGVGNVRIAVFRNGELIRVTAGHTVDVLAKERYVSGNLSRQSAVSLLENHRLYNYVGQDEFNDIEFFDEAITLKSRDIVVLMSDGIYEVLMDGELEEILTRAADCQKTAYEIVERVNKSSEANKDNASIILIRIN